MKSSIVDASPYPPLVGRLHTLAIELGKQIESYLCLQSAAHGRAAKITSQQLLALSTFIVNKRLKPFCKEIERCCVLLTLPAQRDDAGLALLIRAALVLEASLSHPEEGVQTETLTVEAFDLLRRYSRGAPNTFSKVQALRVRAPTKEYWRCLHLSVAKILHHMHKDFDKGSVNDAAAPCPILLLCFQRLANFPLEHSWTSKDTITKLLFVERVSAALASSANGGWESKKGVGLKGRVHEAACRSLMTLMYAKLRPLLTLCGKVDAESLGACEQRIREAFLLSHLLSGLDGSIALVSTLALTRAHIRKLQCWVHHCDPDSHALLLCVLRVTNSLAALLKPDVVPQFANVSALDLEQRCELACQKIYHQSQAASLSEKSAVQDLQAAFRKEMLEIERALARHLRLVHEQGGAVSAEPDVFWALKRMQVAAFCVGDFPLYECASWVLRLYSLAVERRIMLRREFVSLLALLLGMAQEPESNKRQSSQKQFDLAFAQEELVTRQCFAATRLVSSDQLGDFLSRNIRELVVYPEKLYESPQAVRALVGGSRRCILELNMLSTGARDLNVDRVAELSEALEQTHSALCALPDLLDVDLSGLLGPAHHCLRASLNRAAARQNVEDNRGVIAQLYLFLERNLPSVAPKWRRRGLRQRSQQLVNHLDSNLGTVEALVKTGAIAKALGKHPLFERLLVEQRSLLDQLQEELGEAQLVRFVRVRSRLQRFVARQANQAGKLVRLHLHNESLQFRRAIMASLVGPLQQVLRIMIEQGIEDEAVRRLSLKPKASVIIVQVHQLASGISVNLSDDGQEINPQQLHAVQRLLRAIGGELTYDYLPLQGNRLKVDLAG